MGFAAHSLSPVEHKAMLDAERGGSPFLAYRDGRGELRFTDLGERDRVVIGRVTGNDVVLDWDPRVSRAHAELERVGTDWALVDDGLSRNGSLVNGDRVLGRRRLSDGDVLRLGRTTLVFRAPVAGIASTLGGDSIVAARLTPAELRVLVALCAPVARGGPAPATNAEIADALKLSVDGVKTHVRALFVKLDVGDLPRNHKRSELARRAFEHGLVTRAAFAGGDEVT